MAIKGLHLRYRLLMILGIIILLPFLELVLVRRLTALSAEEVILP